MINNIQRAMLASVAFLLLGVITWFGYGVWSPHTASAPTANVDTANEWSDVSVSNDLYTAFHFITDPLSIDISAMAANTIASIDADYKYYVTLRSYPDTEISSVAVKEVLAAAENADIEDIDTVPEPISYGTTSAADVRLTDSFTVGDLSTSDAYPNTRALVAGVENDLQLLVETFTEQHANVVGATHQRVQKMPERAAADGFMYPPLPVVRALALEKLVLILAADTKDRLQTETIINEGIAAGLFFISDTMAAEKLVDLYLEAIFENEAFLDLYTSALLEF